MKLLITTQAVDKNHPILGFFHSWILEFSKYFDEIYVICLQKGEFDLPENVHILSLGKEDGENNLKYLYRFYKYFGQVFFKVKMDYVFFHMGAIYNILAAPFFFLRKFYKTKFYWWKTHGHINFEGRIALLFVDRVYTAIEASFPVHTNKKQVVGHAIDTDLFKFFDSKAKSPTILFVGRFSRSKRLEQVLEITKQLVDKGYEIETRLIGTISDEKYYIEIKELVEKMNLSKVVHFIEGVKQPTLVDEYQKASILVNPSDNDGLDKVVLEAMLCGTIPLTANKSFEKVLDQHDLYLKKGDIIGYTDKAIKIFDMSGDKYKILAKLLNVEVMSKHSLSTLTDRIFNIKQHG